MSDYSKLSDADLNRRDPRPCPGGPDCTCCRPGCDCGCRDDCPVFRAMVRRERVRLNAADPEAALEGAKYAKMLRGEQAIAAQLAAANRKNDRLADENKLLGQRVAELEATVERLCSLEVATAAARKADRHLPVYTGMSREDGVPENAVRIQGVLQAESKAEFRADVRASTLKDAFARRPV